MEFLEKLRKDKKLNRDFEKSLGKIAYHAACHLRAQKIGFPGARVLGAVPDTEVEIIQECSAVDGTWGMKAQHYEMGRKYAQKLVRGVDERRSGAACVVTDCPSRGLAHRARRTACACATRSRRSRRPTASPWRWSDRRSRS